MTQVLILLLAGAAILFAETDLPRVQELFESESIYPQERRQLQVTVRSLWKGGQLGARPDLPVSLEYGLTDSWQIGTRWSRSAEGGQGGSSSIGELSIKKSILNVGGTNNHLAFGLESEFSRDDEKGRRIEPLPFVVAARDFSDGHFQLFGQFGWNLLEEARTGEKSGGRSRWSAGLVKQIGNLALTSEWTNSPRAGRELRQLYWTPGVVHSIRGDEDWQVGVGIPVGLNRHSERVGFVVYMNREFGRPGRVE